MFKNNSTGFLPDTSGKDKKICMIMQKRPDSFICGITGKTYLC